MEKLFSEFKGVTNQEWKDQIFKDLKGVSFESLVSKTANGIDVNPFYTGENKPKTKEALFNTSDWDICEHIEVNDEKKANQQALQALAKGVSGLVFYVHKKINTALLLKDISLEHIYSQFCISNDAVHIINDLKTVSEKKNSFDGKLKCFVNLDPISLFTNYGEWHQSQEKDLDVLKQLVHIPVNASAYQEAGANQVNELAFALAHCNEYFNYLSNQKVLATKTVHVTFSVGGDFFMEIAKLRAFRKLCNLLQQSYSNNFELHIHAQTSQLNKSEKDAYTNFLRSTTEAMSAVIGGANSLTIIPYDYLFSEPNEFSSRMAINQQHILKDESYLNKVADLSAGSYYIEELTDLLAEKAWNKFKDIESTGGLITNLINNSIQDCIAEDFKILLESYQLNKSVLLGVTKYQNAIEKLPILKKRTAAEKGKDINCLVPQRLTEAL